MRGAVRAVVSDDSLAPKNQATLTAVMEKHPPAPADLNLPTPPDDQLAPPITLTTEAIPAAIISFPKSSSAGPDGLRPGHLKDPTGRGAGAATHRWKSLPSQHGPPTWLNEKMSQRWMGRGSPNIRYWGNAWSLFL